MRLSGCTHFVSVGLSLGTTECKASGRPVIAQETGFSRLLPTGEGLFSFATEDEMLAASEALRSDYNRQARAARVIAVEYFDSRKVLSDLLRKVGAVES